MYIKLKETLTAICMFSVKSDILNTIEFNISACFFYLLESKNPKRFGFFYLGFPLILAFMYEIHVFQENGTKGTW
jgi:hypothetical protein